jgi:CRP-like cAMP-binding protein
MTSTENSFIDFISKGHDITNDVCKAIESKILIKKVKKKELLQRKGDTNLKAYYVKSGLLKSYTIDENV